MHRERPPQNQKEQLPRTCPRTQFLLAGSWTDGLSSIPSRRTNLFILLEGQVALRFLDQERIEESSLVQIDAGLFAIRKWTQHRHCDLTLVNRWTVLLLCTHRF